jgi:hypothetical protein
MSLNINKQNYQKIYSYLKNDNLFAGPIFADNNYDKEAILNQKKRVGRPFVVEN